MFKPNGHAAGVVDLAALKARAQQHIEIEAQRESLIGQLLTQTGLQCPCGQRIRGAATVYYTIIEAPVQAPDGELTLGLNMIGHTCCSRDCHVAVTLEGEAIARREGPAGRVTWLDEVRAGRAQRAERQ